MTHLSTDIGGDSHLPCLAALSSSACSPPLSRPHKMPLRFALVIAFAAAAVPSELECGARRIALEQATTLLPDRPLLPSELFDALELQDCGDTPPAARARTRAPDVAKTKPRSDDFVLRVNAAADGSSDAMTFKTVARAVDAARALRPAERAVRIELAEGVHFLNQTLELDARDANTTIAGAPLDADGAPTSWLSGGELLKKDSLEWARATEMFGAGTPVWVATVPESVASNLSGLFTLAPHRRLTRARYPNGDAELTQWGYNSVGRMDYSLPLEGVAEWVKVRVLFFSERNFTARDAQCSFAISIVVNRSGEARSFSVRTGAAGDAADVRGVRRADRPGEPDGRGEERQHDGRLQPLRERLRRRVRPLGADENARLVLVLERLGGWLG